MSHTAKPGKLLLASSVLVIVGCVFLLSFALSGLWNWGPCGMVACVIIAPFPLTIGLDQYRGTFRGNASAARTAAGFLFFLAALISLPLSIQLYEYLSAGSPADYPAALVITGLTAAACGVAAWNDIRWARELDRLANIAELADAAASNQSGRQVTLRELAGLVVVLCATLAWTRYLVRSEGPQYAEHVHVTMAPRSLPREAKDISYCRGSRGLIAYEFTIDEDGFRRWVEGIGSHESRAAKVQLKPIDGSTTVPTYRMLHPQLGGPNHVTVKNGLEYFWWFEDRRVHAVFDRSTGRAYYYFQTY